jgi:hypothetical protein
MEQMRKEAVVDLIVGIVPSLAGSVEESQENDQSF